MLSESDYLSHAQDCLEKVANWADGLDADAIDFSTRDGMVTLEFPDGVKFVLNRQGPARQIWLAAVDKAWHYDWDAARQTWIDDRDGHELYGRLAEVVSDKIGQPVRF